MNFKILLRISIVFLITNSAAIGQYKVTKNAAISGHNVEHLSGVTPSECANACNNKPWCMSFDYYKRQNKCDLSNMNSRNVGLKKNYSGNPYDHYEKLLTRDAAPQNSTLRQKSAVNPHSHASIAAPITHNHGTRSHNHALPNTGMAHTHGGLPSATSSLQPKSQEPAVQMQAAPPWMTRLFGKKLYSSQNYSSRNFIVVKSDRTLGGTWEKKTFEGTWEFRNGRFCKILTKGFIEGETCHKWTVNGYRLREVRGGGYRDYWISDESIYVNHAQEEEGRQQAGSIPRNHAQIIREDMKETLLDPRSVIDFSTTEPVYTVCRNQSYSVRNGFQKPIPPIYGWIVTAKYNTKNKFGGYSGLRKTVYFIQSGKVIDTTNRRCEPK